jgi:hypothetical protein
MSPQFKQERLERLAHDFITGTRLPLRLGAHGSKRSFEYSRNAQNKAMARSRVFELVGLEQMPVTALQR